MMDDSFLDDYEKQMIGLLQSIDQGQKQMLAAIGQLIQLQARPRRVVRDGTGKALGVE